MTFAEELGVSSLAQASARGRKASSGRAERSITDARPVRGISGIVGMISIEADRSVGSMPGAHNSCVPCVVGIKLITSGVWVMIAGIVSVGRLIIFHSNQPRIQTTHDLPRSFDILPSVASLDG